MEGTSLGWGEFGRFERLLKEEGARDVVLIGGVKVRPDFKHLKLDFATMKMLPEIVRILAGGDNELLSGVVRIIEKRGYRVIGAHEVATDLVAADGPLGRHKAAAADRRAVERAMEAARAIGAVDAGQAAVSFDGRVVALEAAEGTDEMLKRVATLRDAGRIKWKGRTGVLAKCAKPQQDLRVDMPAIGPQTVDGAVAAGLSGIAVESGRVMIVEREEVIRRADAAGIFVIGESGAPR